MKKDGNHMNTKAAWNKGIARLKSDLDQQQQQQQQQQNQQQQSKEEEELERNALVLNNSYDDMDEEDDFLDHPPHALMNDDDYDQDQKFQNENHYYKETSTTTTTTTHDSLSPLEMDTDYGSANDDDNDLTNNNTITNNRNTLNPNKNNNFFSSSSMRQSPPPPLWTNMLPHVLTQFLFPPDDPPATQLLRTHNLAIPACYLTVGLLQGLSGPFINVYPLFLGASEAQQATLSSIRSLPATFKLLFGFMSDNLPFLGYRRKSYMFLGWCISALSMLLLLIATDLSRISVDNDNNNYGNNDNENPNNGNNDPIYQPPENAPSIPFLSFVLLAFGTGFWLADVMGDSLVAEKAKLEPPDRRGHLQSTCYACRFFGLMIAAPCSTVLLSHYGPRSVVILMTIIPILMLPLILLLQELKNIPITPTKVQCLEIWKTVCSRAVWQPMAFVYIYNVLQVSNAAWREFLRSILGFTDIQLNTLLIVAYVLLYLGVLTYKYYFIQWSWRSIYVLTTCINGVLSALQVLLIQGITFGLSPFLFALGDDVFADFIAGIQFLPTTIMMVHLCPTGSEGASYAMFTTVNNSALNLASAISTMLLSIWDVSKSTMLSGDLSGMTKLTMLTTILQTSGVLFVSLLPRTKEDLIKLHHDQDGNMNYEKNDDDIHDSLYPTSHHIPNDDDDDVHDRKDHDHYTHNTHDIISHNKDQTTRKKAWRNERNGFIFLLVTFLSILYAIIVGILNILKPGWAGES